VDEEDWQRLIDQLRRGDCTPFLGAGASVRMIPSATVLSHQYADRYEYPFTDTHNLARVMQYAEAVLRDPVDLKVEVCRFLRSLGRMPPDDPGDMHTLLASLPLKTFLTTNYDDFLVDALRQEGKKPHTAVSAWWNTDPADALLLPEPTPDKPIVYHLHGSWSVPASLVLTETDYLTYLVNMVDAPAAHGRHPLPTPILLAMTKPLLFIGYSLQDWTFRVLFHGLARDTPNRNRRRHVSVQLMPEVNDSARGAESKARRYLRHYLNGWNISIFLGSASEFCQELRRRMERPS
jgi:hypothetical protein